MIPDPSNPQAWNRYSYVTNNPIRYNDPSGHCSQTGDDWCFVENGGGGGGGGDDDDDENNSIEIDLYVASAGAEWDEDNLTIYFGLGKDSCDETCQMWAEGMGIGAFAVDSVAAGLNGLMAAGMDMALFVYPPAAGVIALAWKMASPGINALGTVGTFGWAAQGLLLGTNGASGKIKFSVAAPMLISGMGASVKLSQDTMASGALDALGWFAPEPNSAAGVSVAGVAYDLLRNPAPSFFNYDPPLPSWFDFSASVSFGDITLP